MLRDFAQPDKRMTAATVVPMTFAASPPSKSAA
jgi:hypothetical protein